ncbi:MAG: DUF1611 domain-containing protein [Woeseiaceae bacterium]|nr:DUF1611 domain-containing protein [Woeseiaceae bacterium]
MPLYAKTGFGIVQWRRDKVAGQLRFPGCAVDLGVPDMAVAEAAAAGVRSLIIGVAPVGGTIPSAWWAVIQEAAEGGLDIVCGLHVRLSDFPGLVTRAATASGARLVDVRVPPQGLPVGSGRKRSGRRVLTVGTDCAVGKKYSALALHGGAAGCRSRGDVPGDRPDGHHDCRQGYPDRLGRCRLRFRGRRGAVAGQRR